MLDTSPPTTAGVVLLHAWLGFCKSNHGGVVVYPSEEGEGQASSVHLSVGAQVAIIGGGPAGLTMAHALLKLPTGVEQVKVFEQKNESLPGIGGGIQINGGAAVLSRSGSCGRGREG